MHCLFVWLFHQKKALNGVEGLCLFHWCGIVWHITATSTARFPPPRFRVNQVQCSWLCSLSIYLFLFRSATFLFLPPFSLLLISRIWSINLKLTSTVTQCFWRREATPLEPPSPTLVLSHRSLWAFWVTWEDPYSITPAWKICDNYDIQMRICAKISSERCQVGIIMTFKMKKKNIMPMMSIEKKTEIADEQIKGKGTNRSRSERKTTDSTNKADSCVCINACLWESNLWSDGWSLGRCDQWHFAFPRLNRWA